MKLTINLYAALERYPANTRISNAMEWTEDISYYLNKLFPTGLKFEIIDEKSHSEWVWLSMTGAAHENSQDEDILEWLKDDLPDLLSFLPIEDIKLVKFSGEMGQYTEYPVNEKWYSPLR